MELVYNFGKCCSVDGLLYLFRYDGIFLIAVDQDRCILYSYESGDSQENIPYRYWAIDYSNRKDLLSDLIENGVGPCLNRDGVVRGHILNGLVPASIKRVEIVDEPYGIKMVDESPTYLGHLPLI